MTIQNPNLAGIFITYDKSRLTLVVVERTATENGLAADKQLLEFSFSKFKEADHHVVEKTLGEIVLYALEKATPGGLGFGEYSSLLDRISEENLKAFSDGLDLSNSEDQYSLAIVLFAHARRDKSWEMVERAIELFKQSASKKHPEAMRFLEEDLPLVLPRLEEKLKPKDKLGSDTNLI